LPISDTRLLTANWSGHVALWDTLEGATLAETAIRGPQSSSVITGLAYDRRTRTVFASTENRVEAWRLVWRSTFGIATPEWLL